MNLLYLAPLPVDINNLDGIPKKIFYHLKALSSSYDCRLIYHFGGNIRLYDYNTKEEKILNPGKNRLDVIKAAITLCRENLPDAMYIRYPRSDRNLLKLCRLLSSKNVNYVIEIPTYPYDREGGGSLKGHIINFIDRVYRKKLHRYVPRIVTFSSDDHIFGIQTIRTINGIDFDLVRPDLTPVDFSQRIEGIAVSAMYPGHGYDRFIEGLHNYYKNGGQRNVVLKLVGDGSELQRYQNAVKDYNLEQHVIFMGKKLGEDLNRAYEGSAVGINSLAIHRLGLTAESTLKTKEYAAKGLPVLSSSYVDAFSEEGNRSYAMIIPPDDSPVDIEEFIRFTDRVYGNGDTESVRNSIREDGRNTCDIRITMKPVTDYLTSGR